jgi:hypothetical protein
MADETFGRRIVEVLPMTAGAGMLLLDGGPFALAADLLHPFLHWRAGRFGGAAPSYALVPGSPGIDAGDPGMIDGDGSRIDAGAYGGAGGPEVP